MVIEHSSTGVSCAAAKLACNKNSSAAQRMVQFMADFSALRRIMSFGR